MRRAIEPELAVLRQRAEELAKLRRQPLCGVHLLAAMAAHPGATSDLLVERKLTSDRLLSVASELGFTGEEPLRASVQRARELAMRMGVQTATPAHLLVALLNESRGSARRAVETCGADVGRLRTAAMNLGLGIIGRRRAVGMIQVEPKRRPLQGRAASAASSASSLPGTIISVVPQLPPGPLGRVTGRGLPGRRGPVKEAPGKPAPETGVPAKASTPPASLDPAPKPPAPHRSSARGRPAPRSGKIPARPSSSKDKSAPGSSETAVSGACAARFELDPKQFPTLTRIGKNLTLSAAAGELDPVVGREAEIDQTLDVLAKREGNSPCLVGVAGVGKTSVVRGLAQRIVSGEAVRSLDDRIIIELPVSELLAGTGVRGALATRFANLRKEIRAARGRVVVFFDEIQQLFSGDAADEISSDFKLALSRGEFPCIGATTLEDYRRSIESDAALCRRFSLVEVGEPSREDAFLILSALSKRLEQHHGVRYAEEALALSIAWSARYLTGRALPDKAVSIVDLAGARVRRRGGENVEPAHVAEVVATMADMPIERLLESDRERMLRLEEILAERIVGHQHHIAQIARILRRNAAGLGAKRPIGTFLLLGPTGVGKTETAKAIAEVLFHSETAMTRIDLSEFSEAHAVAKLIGAPPGYVGHEAGGVLTEAVRRRPYQVILLDEIEKAHPEVLTTFLALFDEGRLSDGRGRTVDFTNTVIVMTSNIGAEQSPVPSKRRVGFGADAAPQEATYDAKVTAAARAALAPELYNRIDEVLAFSALDKADVQEIARRLLTKLASELRAQRGIILQVDELAIDVLLSSGGFDPSLGARPMRRMIARLIEAPLAERILSGELRQGDVALVTRNGEGGLGFDTLRPEDSDSDCAAE